MTIQTVTFEIREGVDGKNKVFSSPSAFTEGTLRVVLVNEANATLTPVQAESLGDGFFVLESAPAAGELLRITYEMANVETSPPVTFTDFERKNFDALVGLVVEQSRLIRQMDLALKERVSRSEFDKWATQMEARLQLLTQSSLLEPLAQK